MQRSGRRKTPKSAIIKKEAHRKRQKTTHTHRHKYCSWLELLHLAAITVRLPPLPFPSWQKSAWNSLNYLCTWLAQPRPQCQPTHTHAHTQVNCCGKNKAQKENGQTHAAQPTSLSELLIWKISIKKTNKLQEEQRCRRRQRQWQKRIG